MYASQEKGLTVGFLEVCVRLAQKQFVLAQAERVTEECCRVEVSVRVGAFSLLCATSVKVPNGTV